MDLVVFWIAAPVAVGAAILMLVQRNAVHSALFLILNQFMLAVFFVLLGAPFLAAVQVIVYAGAIMVLFLFVIMFLGVDRREALVETIRGQRVVAIALGLLLVAEVVVAVRLGVGIAGAAVAEVGPGFGSIEAVGRRLFTQYVFPFEVTSILLIVAAVAAMVLARRRARGLPEPGQAAEPERPRPREPEADPVR
ncbi:MAG TPA: NADH-quinone oxidoreductase subunit J [Actinomycetota bacterium]|nr:NADH-quinone oxidoreductase subunit J [Actinomycetota bacterium]